MQCTIRAAGAALCGLTRQARQGGKHSYFFALQRHSLGKMCAKKRDPSMQ